MDTISTHISLYQVISRCLSINPYLLDIIFRNVCVIYVSQRFKQMFLQNVSLCLGIVEVNNDSFTFILIKFLSQNCKKNSHKERLK